MESRSIAFKETADGGAVIDAETKLSRVGFGSAGRHCVVRHPSGRWAKCRKLMVDFQQTTLPITAATKQLEVAENVVGCDHLSIGRTSISNVARQ
jgi:hypothetical protein